MVDNFWDVVRLLMWYSQLYSLLSYSQRYLGACIVFCVFWVCVWVHVFCVCELGHIWLAFDLGEALRCMPKMWTVGLQLIVTCPWLCGGAYCWEASSQFSAAAFRGEGSFLWFPTDSSIIGPYWWLTKHLWLPPGRNSGLPRDYY